MADAAAFTDGLIIDAAEMARLLAAGSAVRLGETPAVRWGGHWWIGDTTVYVRILDERFSADLDDRARRVAGEA